MKLCAEHAYALDIFRSGAAVFVCAGCGEDTHLRWDPQSFGDLLTWERFLLAVHGDPPRCSSCRRRT